ncbi:hypothetical protein FR483_n481L [Paramecium bursaria Chlorella virus FR483]|uniref:Uncharacterized protein n481L n=1 Tax=Paramecium bursaria Chlorella virus FR483 TaxID=399781 RepID=A7J7I5_PBCVF|nr:hypothetical protein FR483_n481L [Paramecium bursaria Chlorella virus FR483]ABT15766.1 hypothetical protein FR483_n481L [Paramecium bursaria Chlorella virus FR483]
MPLRLIASSVSLPQYTQGKSVILIISSSVIVTDIPRLFAPINIFFFFPLRLFAYDLFCALIFSGFSARSAFTFALISSFFSAYLAFAFAFFFSGFAAYASFSFLLIFSLLFSLYKRAFSLHLSHFLVISVCILPHLMHFETMSSLICI